MRIDVKQSPELLAVLYAMRALDRNIAKFVRQQIKAVAAPEWTKALSRRATTSLQQEALVKTATVSASNQNVRVSSAMKGRPLSGGFSPKHDWHAAEFGGDPSREVEYTRRSRNGGRHTVKRRMGRTLPARNPEGHVYYPTVHEMIPRLGRLFFQTIYRSAANATEGKRE